MATEPGDESEITREYGANRGISELTERKMPTTENKCWEFAVLTRKL
jgi:hypothetical protein